ncbi:MAG: segregation/condensation protein A, partial [Thalassovita sp.]
MADETFEDPADSQNELFQEQSVAERLAAEALIIDVDGYEGPLDLLLTLSRT